MNEFQFIDTVKFLNKKFEDTSKPRELWTKQTIKNLPLIKKENGIWKSKEMLTGDTERALVVIGASPKLEEDVKHLKKLNDNFCTIVVNSALKRVIKAGIKPDYVFMIDSNDKDMVNHLDVDSRDLTLVTSNASSHKAIKRWKGKIIWLPYYGIGKEYVPTIRKLLGRQSPQGGNAFSCAVSVAYDVWDARIFIFVANELCYDDHYYADKKSKWERKNVMHFRIKDINGKDRLTNIPLYQYKMWLEKMIDQVPNCTFIDTSFGALGTDSQRLQHMTLSDAIEKINAAFVTKNRAKEDWHYKEKCRYNLAYASGYAPQNGIKSWRKIFKNIPEMRTVKTVLDVGCGFGEGVATCRNKGIEAWGIDIADNLGYFWGLANVTKFCKVASADAIPFPDNSMELVTSFDVLEHIPEEAVLNVLREMYRVAQKHFMVTICIIPAISKMVDGSEPHICLKSSDWWIGKVKEAGFTFVTGGMNFSQTTLTIYATKETRDARSKVSGHDLHVQPAREMPRGQANVAV